MSEVVVTEMPPEKTVHMAKMISRTGGVSPWCARIPKRINLKKATWTNRWEAVTCNKCKDLRPHLLSEQATLAGNSPASPESVTK